MSIESVNNLAKCMESLGIPRTGTAGTRIEATIEVAKYNLRGPIMVEFHPDGGEGPYLSLDPAIRGFGIACEQFRPSEVRMRFDRRKGVLRLSRDDEFDLGLQFALEPGG